MKTISAQDTLLSKGKTEHIEKELKTLFAKINPANMAYNISLEASQPVFLIGKYEEERDIPPLLTPIVITQDSAKLIVCDLRSYIRYNPSETNIDLLLMTSSIEQVNLEITRVLMMDALMNDSEVFTPFTNAIVRSETAWMTNVIKNAFSANVIEALTIEVIFNFYFMNMLLDNGSADRVDLNELILHRTKNIMKGSDAFIMQVIETHKIPTNVNELMKELNGVSLKMEKVDIYGIVNLLSRVFIPNPAFNVLLSLENLPTMVTLIWAFTTQRTNSKAIFNITAKYVKELDELTGYINRTRESNIL